MEFYWLFVRNYSNYSITVMLQKSWVKKNIDSKTVKTLSQENKISVTRPSESEEKSNRHQLTHMYTRLN